MGRMGGKGRRAGFVLAALALFAAPPHVRADVDARDETQGTLLMYFARRGNAGPVQWLLAHGADRNARNKSGKTAAEIGRAHAGIVRLLTEC